MEDAVINKWIKLSIIAGTLLISFSVFYYFVIFLPSKEKTKAEQLSNVAKQEKLARQICQQVAVENAVEFYKSRSKENSYLYAPADGRYLKPDYEDYYKQCLRGYGLDE